MDRSRLALLRSLCLLPLCAWLAVGNAAIAPPRPKSVRIIYLVSADRTVREDFKKGIETAAKDLQAMVRQTTRRSYFPTEHAHG